VSKTILSLGDYGATGLADSVRPQLHTWHQRGAEIWQLVHGYNGWCGGVNRNDYPWAERILPIFGQNAQEMRFGASLLHEAVKLSQADFVVTGLDIWMTAYLSMPEHPMFGLSNDAIDILRHERRRFKHVAYIPIDGAVGGRHLPDGMADVVRGYDVPVTYSRFGQQILKNEGIDVPFIPIAHDPQHFHPGSKNEARKKLNLPVDKFIIAMVGTNQYRKQWGVFFDAASRLAKAHSDVLIIPWTTWNAKILGGAEIGPLIARSGVGEQVVNPGAAVGSLPDVDMGNFYRAIDLLCLVTIGEGAGLPPIRARACGTPALVSDNTSNTEFAADPRELIPCNGKMYDPIGSNLERYLTDPDALYERMEEFYASKDLRLEVGNKGAVAMQQYEVKNVMKLWDELLGDMT
jgi:glycosyltransferase involved in cell wall biosynthesis